VQPGPRATPDGAPNDLYYSIHGKFTKRYGENVLFLKNILRSRLGFMGKLAQATGVALPPVLRPCQAEA